jgi:hypothetical protein
MVGLLFDSILSEKHLFCNHYRLLMGNKNEKNGREILMSLQIFQFVHFLQSFLVTFHYLDAPSAVSSQTVKGGKAAFFFIPPPVRLSMSKAIQVSF